MEVVNSPSGTNKNSASSSTNRLINQGHATRSTLMFSRVIHRIGVSLFETDYCLVAAGAFGLPVSLNAALKPVASFSAGPVPQ